jgi:hypothetical protein
MKVSRVVPHFGRCTLTQPGRGSQTNKISRKRARLWSSPFSVGLLALAFFFGALATAHASFGFNLDGTLDKPVISKAYFESDFERIVLPLETWRQVFAENKTRDDSIFVFKYLSIIYAANPATKEKSKSFMFQLLTLAPNIEILDMYATDEIERMFRSVKQEFRERNAYISTHDHLGKERPKPEMKKPITSQRNEPPSAKWVWWFAGGAGLAAAVGATFFFYEPEHETKKIIVPVWQGGDPQ